MNAPRPPESPSLRRSSSRLGASVTGAHIVAIATVKGPEDDIVVEARHRLDFLAPAAIPARVRWVKRTIDIAAGLVGLALLWPVMLVVGLAVRLTSKGPAFYHQERVKRVRADGTEQTFRMFKFRTMVTDAEKLSGPKWAEEDDPRITPIGRVLRKTRLDEVPQFWNVLRGDMSLVGPRPERPHFTQNLKEAIPVYEDRAINLKPGITGWAQVRCPYDSSVDSVRSKLQYDLAYAAHLYRLRSFLLMETKIVLLTFVVVFTGKGAR